MNPKAIGVRLQDENGKVVVWTVKRDPRPPATWDFVDHEGYRRCVEGNWFALVHRLKATAENYNMTLLS